MTRSPSSPLAFGAWWILTAVLLLSPGSEVPSGPDWLLRLAELGADKWVHLVLFAGLGWLLVGCLRGSRPGLWALLLCVGWALVSETLQVWVPYRDPELLDVVADIVGAAGAIALWTRAPRPVP